MIEFSLNALQLLSVYVCIFHALTQEDIAIGLARL